MEWLDNDERSLIHDPVKVEQLRTMHEQLHAEVKRIFALLGEGNTELVGELIDPLKDKCRAMGEMLKTLLVEASQVSSAP